MRRSQSLLVSFVIGLLVLLSSFAIGIYFSKTNRSQLPSVYDNYLAEGEQLFQQGKFPEAAERYRIASSINREDPAPLLRLGSCLEKMQRDAEAKQAFSKAARLNQGRY